MAFVAPSVGADPQDGFYGVSNLLPFCRAQAQYRANRQTIFAVASVSRAGYHGFFINFGSDIIRYG